MSPALITSIESVGLIYEKHRLLYGNCVPLVATSGGFDPLHVGHLRCLRASSMLKGDVGLFTVIVNGDGFLMRKKGYVFMPLEERMELIAAIGGIDYVVAWDDGGQYVTGALNTIKPNIFAKGGERSSVENVPEKLTCDKIGCQIVFGIGGTSRIQSSSELIKNLQVPDKKRKNKNVP